MNNNTLWQAFTIDESDETIIAAFSRRWGIAPEIIVRERALALAGPVPVPAETEEHQPDVESPCQVCGLEMEWVACWDCGGDGTVDQTQTDPLEGDPFYPCVTCGGNGGCPNADDEQHVNAEA